jgi:hypothetical protein
MANLMISIGLKPQDFKITPGNSHFVLLKDLKQIPQN